MNAEAPKRKNLGRGLSALFGDDDAPSTADTTITSTPSGPSALNVPASATTKLPLDLLNPSPFQPRKHFDETALDELAASVKEKGVLQPLLVRADADHPGRFQIIAGERRWRAAQRANVHEVPVHVMDLTDQEVLEVALIENLQRQDLSAVEEARGYKRLMDEFSHTQEQLAEAVGRSRAHVANTLRLLSLPHTVLMLLEAGKLTAGQVRPLIGNKSADALAQIVLKRGLSARQAERLAKGFGRQQRQKAVIADTDTAALQQSLEQAIGYKVDIKFDGKGGSVSVAYANLEQLDDIVKRLSSGGHVKTDADDRDEAPAVPDPKADDVGASPAVDRIWEG